MEYPLITLIGQANNEVAQLNALQQVLAPYESYIATGWWFVWFITGFILIRFVYQRGMRNVPHENDLYTKNSSKHERTNNGFGYPIDIQ